MLFIPKVFVGRHSFLLGCFIFVVFGHLLRFLLRVSMAAASVAGVVGGKGSSSSSWMKQFKGNKGKKMNKFRISCSSSSVADPYKTLRIQPDASESEVRKAFRQLALKYHPDVCRGNNCGVQFHQINEAYDVCNNHMQTKFPPKF